VQSRMTNPVFILPEAMQAMFALNKSIEGNLPLKTRKLVHLRASQINGCSVCTDMHARDLKKEGETDERLWSAAAWRDAPYFTDAERAALALAEAATRLDDRADAVPDDVWQEATRHYNEAELATLILTIALINFFNRVNVPIRQLVAAHQ